MAETATLTDSYTEMTEVLLPNDTNNLGRALGGAVLHWIDMCGAVSAMRFSRRQCVTAAMDHVDFIQVQCGNPPLQGWEQARTLYSPIDRR